MAEAIRGLNTMRRKLDRLAKSGSKRVTRAGAVGMTAPLRKKIRQGVSGVVFPETWEQQQSIKRAAKSAVGSRVRSEPLGDYSLKVGFGVGRPTKAKRAKATARHGAGKRRSEGGESGVSGVGLSATNIHWLVLGTGGKKTGVRRKKSGASTGSTEAVLLGVVPRAVASGSRAALKEGARRARIALKKEARKKR